MSESQGELIGIDLGTSYCSVGYWKRDRVHIVPNEYGHRKTYSCLSFDNDEVFIGESASYSSVSNPENVIFDLLSLVGIRYSEGFLSKFFPFTICAGTNDSIFIKVSYKGQQATFSPEELLALLLRRLKSDVEMHMGREVTGVCMAISFTLNMTQKRAIRDACQLAGLKLSRLLFSPTATAYVYTCYNMHCPEKMVLVVDCGGGTVSASLCVVERGICEVRAVSGASGNNAGGRSYDYALMQYCDQIIARQFGMDIWKHPKVLARLRVACERAKIALSQAVATTIVVENITAGVDFRETLSRSDFENIISRQLAQCLATVDDALAIGRVRRDQVQLLILTGGSAHVPKIQQMLKSHLDKAVYQHGDASLSPLHGVAMIAGFVVAWSYEKPTSERSECDEWLADSLLLDVQQCAIGIVGPDTTRTTLVRRGITSMPLKKSQTIMTTSDNQESMVIPVWEGMSGLEQENCLVGMLQVNGIPPAPAGKEGVNITVDSHENECIVYATLGSSEVRVAQVSCGIENEVLPPPAMVARHCDILCYETCVVQPRQVAEALLENEIGSSMRVLDSDVIVREVQGGVRNGVQDFLTSSLAWLDGHRSATEEEYVELRSRVVTRMRTINEVSSYYMCGCNMYVFSAIKR
jgi:molecular chaperone DnaK (HSP70)